MILLVWLSHLRRIYEEGRGERERRGTVKEKEKYPTGVVGLSKGPEGWGCILQD